VKDMLQKPRHRRPSSKRRIGERAPPGVRNRLEGTAWDTYHGGRRGCVGSSRHRRAGRCREAPHCCWVACPHTPGCPRSHPNQRSHAASGHGGRQGSVEGSCREESGTGQARLEIRGVRTSTVSRQALPLTLPGAHAGLYTVTCSSKCGGAVVALALPGDEAEYKATPKQPLRRHPGERVLSHD
jgi:hypothetical protein